MLLGFKIVNHSVLFPVSFSLSFLFLLLFFFLSSSYFSSSSPLPLPPLCLSVSSSSLFPTASLQKNPINLWKKPPDLGLTPVTFLLISHGNKVQLQCARHHPNPFPFLLLFLGASSLHIAQARSSVSIHNPEWHRGFDLLSPIWDGSSFPRQLHGPLLSRDSSYWFWT